MRVVAMQRDLIVFVSGVWQTTATAVRAGGEGFLIDSPVLPDELETLPGVLEQSGFPVSGLLVTHGDWDHLLGRLVFPEASLGCGEDTARRLAASPGAAQRELRAFDDKYYIERNQPLGLGAVQMLPVPGRLALGASEAKREIELIPAAGHTSDGTAYWIPWLEVLVCGDYLSPVELPLIEAGGTAEQYLVTLERLRPIVARAKSVIPGHGRPLEREHALALLEEDLAYVRELSSAGSAGGGGGAGAATRRRRS